MTQEAGLIPQNEPTAEPFPALDPTQSWQRSVSPNIRTWPIFLGEESIASRTKEIYYTCASIFVVKEFSMHVRFLFVLFYLPFSWANLFLTSLPKFSVLPRPLIQFMERDCINKK